jgi:hypothetical protein
MVAANKDNEHWYLLTADTRMMQITVIDSFRRDRLEVVKDPNVQLLKEYMEQGYEKGSWNVQVQEVNVEQNNSYDCGLFTCMNMRQVVNSYVKPAQLLELDYSTIGGRKSIENDLYGGYQSSREQHQQQLEEEEKEKQYTVDEPNSDSEMQIIEYAEEKKEEKKESQEVLTSSQEQLVNLRRQVASLTSNGITLAHYGVRCRNAFAFKCIKCIGSNNRDRTKYTSKLI